MQSNVVFLYTNKKRFDLKKELHSNVENTNCYDYNQTFRMNQISALNNL